MYVGRDFSPAETTESQLFGLDFINDLGDGETLTAATWYLTVTQGVDATPSSHLVGGASLVTPAGTTVQSATQQRISGLLPDVTYAARAEVTTSAGNTLSLWTHIQGINVD